LYSFFFNHKNNNRKTPSIAALVTPGAEKGNHKVFFGTTEIMLPVYGTTAEAAAEHPKADVFINFASHRSAFASSLQAIGVPTLRTGSYKILSVSVSPRLRIVPVFLLLFIFVLFR